MIEIEEKIKSEIKQRGLKPIDVYRKLGINRVNYYKAISSSNLNNPSLKKILEYLELEVYIELRKMK